MLYNVYLMLYNCIKYIWIMIFFIILKNVYNYIVVMCYIERKYNKRYKEIFNKRGGYF